MSREIFEEMLEPKYRQFRWTLAVPGIPAWAMRKIEMVNGHRMKIEFVYIGDMDIGTCPVPPGSGDKFQEATLSLLDSEGNVVRKAELKFTVEDYVPAIELDYASSQYVTGRVILWVLNPIAWS